MRHSTAKAFTLYKVGGLEKCQDEACVFCTVVTDLNVLIALEAEYAEKQGDISLLYTDHVFLSELTK